MTLKKDFQADQVFCMNLREWLDENPCPPSFHDPRYEVRRVCKQFNIPSSQPLAV